MRHTIYILTFLIFLSVSAGAQILLPANKLTGVVQSDLKQLLPGRRVKADIMDGVTHNPRQVELLMKFQSAVQENQEWFIEYVKTIPQGQPMPYHQNIGLTEEEYTELQEYLNNVEVVSSGQEDINIEAGKGFISFKSSNKLAAFDSLTIDLEQNIIQFGQFKLAFSDTLNITTDKNGLKSKWSGYSWKYEEPKNLDMDALKDLSSLNMVQFEFVIGRLEKNGKTFMRLKGTIFEDGVKVVHFELPVLF